MAGLEVENGEKFDGVACVRGGENLLIISFSFVKW
jgi:hypothetical protein